MSERVRDPHTSGNNTWAAHRSLAVAVRMALFAVPILAGSVAILILDQWFWSLESAAIATRFLQAVIVGAFAATVVDRQTRRLLPFATLLGLSLTFPGEAPSRLAVAVRAGTISQEQIAATVTRGLDDDPTTAATEAIGLVTALGSHGRLTTGMTEHISAQANAIARELGVSDQDREKLAWAVLLHDIGELRIPRELIDKGGQLTPAESETFESHTVAGESFIAPLGDWLGSWRFATSQHHERWDGTGYPKGIGGERITLSGRIVAAVDTYNVLTRESSSPRSPEQAKAEILAASGTHLDPSVAQALIAVTPDTPAGPFAALLPSTVLPGVAVHAGQGVAVVIAAAVMATTLRAAPDSLALAADGPVATSAVELSTTTAPDTDRERADQELNSSTTTEPRTFPLTELTSAPKPSTTTIATTVPEPSTTAAPTTAVPTTAAPTTTAPPTTTPHNTAAPTTTVGLVTTSVVTTAAVGPAAIDDEVNARQDRNKRIDVLANDSAGPTGSQIDIDTLVIVQLPAHGTAEIKSGQVSYHSDGDHIGVDTLTYQICNELGLCSTAKVTITVR